MSAEQITLIKAIADIIANLGTMPIASIILVMVFGPWLVLMFVGWRQEKRFEAVVKMYEDNVQLVKDYQSLVTGYQKIVDGQQDLIIYATQTLTSIRDVAENNLYCPMVRKETKETKEPRG